MLSLNRKVQSELMKSTSFLFIIMHKIKYTMANAFLLCTVHFTHFQ